MKYSNYLIFTYFTLTFSFKYHVDVFDGHRIIHKGEEVIKRDRDKAQIIAQALNILMKRNANKRDRNKYKEDVDVNDEIIIVNQARRSPNQFRRTLHEDEFLHSDSHEENILEQHKQSLIKDTFLALNLTPPDGHVNMLMANPLGKDCEDSLGHCIMISECPPEFVLSHQDCGTTAYVCCVVHDIAYDTMIPLGLSLESDTELDTLEYPEPRGPSKKKLQHMKGHKDRRLQKKRLAMEINNVVKAMKKVFLTALSTNSKARALAQFEIKSKLTELKNHYLHDKTFLQDKLENELIVIDNNLLLKLDQLLKSNLDYFEQDNMQNLILTVNGTKTMTRNSARKLMEHFPELREYFPDLQPKRPKSLIFDFD